MFGNNSKLKRLELDLMWCGRLFQSTLAAFNRNEPLRGRSRSQCQWSDGRLHYASVVYLYPTVYRAALDCIRSSSPWTACMEEGNPGNVPDYGSPFFARLSFKVAFIGVGMVTADIYQPVPSWRVAVTEVSIVVVVVSTEAELGHCCGTPKSQTHAEWWGCCWRLPRSWSRWR